MARRQGTKLGHDGPMSDQPDYIHPFYHQAYNEIVQPDRFVACSRYFVLKWGPLLQSRAFHLVLFLRAHGYYNPQTGERRDAIPMARRALARGMGCSYDTIHRMLQEPVPGDFPGKREKFEEAWGQWDLLRRFVWSKPHTDPSGGTDYNVYHVAMDDPLLDEDIAHLEEIADRKREEQEARQRPNPGVPSREPQNAYRGEANRNGGAARRVPGGTQAESGGMQSADPIMYRYTKTEIPETDIPKTDNSMVAPDVTAKKQRGIAVAANTATHNSAPTTIMSAEDELVVALVAQDVNRADALRLAVAMPEECRRQLEYLPHVTEFRSGKGAYLRSAIENGYGAPKEYREAQQQAQKVQKRARIQQSRTEISRQQQAQVEAARARVQADPSTWEAVLAEAKQRMPKILRDRPQNPSYEPALQACINVVVTEWEVKKTV